MRHAITACAVMAFSLVAGIARAEDTGEHDTIDWGEVNACDPDQFDPKMAPSKGPEKLLAAYSESGNVTLWVRVLQRGEAFFVETSLKDGMMRVRHTRPRRHRIDPELARQISANLAAGMSRHVFEKATDEIQVDGIWYLFTVDGKTCASVPEIALTPDGESWARIFSEMFRDSPQREANAWFWLGQASQHPSTLPTPLADAGEDGYVAGAASTWKHPGAEPMAIVDHRAHIDGELIEIVGELANNLDSARQYAKVVATYLDSNGKVMATDTTYADFSLLPPGERSPFDFYTKVKDAASYTLRIDPGDPEKSRPASVRVADHREKRLRDEDDDELIVNGSVLNEGKTDEKSVEVCLLIYDDAGHLLGAEAEDVSDPLKAGASAPFEVSIDLPPGYHHYELVVNPEYREARDEN